MREKAMHARLRKVGWVLGLLAVGLLLADVAVAAGPRGRGGSGGHGRGMRGRGGPGGGQDVTWQRDHAGIHQLFMVRAKIRRDVKDLADGVETLTESDDPAVARLIQMHVAAMKSRVETGRPIRRRDPLFAALFAQAGAIRIAVENTPKGVHVIEKGGNPLAVKLVQAHAQVVSLFLANGHAEAMKPHLLTK